MTASAEEIATRIRNLVEQLVATGYELDDAAAAVTQALDGTIVVRVDRSGDLPKLVIDRGPAADADDG